MANLKGNGTVISSFDYSFDAVGNPTGFVEADGSRVTLIYDAKYQLTREYRTGAHAYGVTYTYDSLGNRLTKLTNGVTTTYTYDAANQLTVENEGGTLTTYSYDQSGNLTVQNVNGSVTTYTWDGENRLATVTLPGGSVTTFTYAANGLRRKTVVGGSTKIFVWDHQNVLLDTGADGTTHAAYTQTPDRYGALVAQRRSGASIFYHFDALGSMTELTNSAQTVTDVWRYYAFGETKASTGSTPNPFQFVGRLGYYTETTLGLQYLRARWYKPAAGRFLSTDPVGSASRYGYAGNRPATAMDPSGMQNTLEPCEYLRAHGISGVPCEGMAGQGPAPRGSPGGAVPGFGPTLGPWAPGLQNKHIPPNMPCPEDGASPTDDPGADKARKLWERLKHDKWLFDLFAKFWADHHLPGYQPANMALEFEKWIEEQKKRVDYDLLKVLAKCLKSLYRGQKKAYGLHDEWRDREPEDPDDLPPCFWGSGLPVAYRFLRTDEAKDLWGEKSDCIELVKKSYGNFL